MSYDELDVGMWKGKDNKRAVGENCRTSKLTKNDVVEIKKRLAAGERNIDIAKDYNVVANTISDIKRGKRWKEIRDTP